CGRWGVGDGCLVRVLSAGREQRRVRRFAPTPHTQLPTPFVRSIRRRGSKHHQQCESAARGEVARVRALLREKRQRRGEDRGDEHALPEQMEKRPTDGLSERSSEK